MLKKLIEILRDKLINGSVIHLHQEVAGSPRELIDLMDRFLDDKFVYPLEWDDFISWENDNVSIENIRQQLGVHENLLFSKNKKKIDAYKHIVCIERNKLAGIIGISPREFLNHTDK